MQRKLKNQIKDWTDITVGSTEEFQGQERRIIIISTVRSKPTLLQSDYEHKLGFLNNPKRYRIISKITSGYFKISFWDFRLIFELGLFSRLYGIACLSSTTGSELGYGQTDTIFYYNIDSRPQQTQTWRNIEVGTYVGFAQNQRYFNCFTRVVLSNLSNF